MYGQSSWSRNSRNASRNQSERQKRAHTHNQFYGQMQMAISNLAHSPETVTPEALGLIRKAQIYLDDAAKIVYKERLSEDGNSIEEVCHGTTLRSS